MPLADLPLLLWGTWTAGAVAFEAHHQRLARRVPHRFLVSGIRGKTTTVRLLHAGLRALGMRTLGRVTGDAPVLLMPDGSERNVHRFGPPNIREMRRSARMAGRMGCDALCLENMAIRPDLARLVADFAVLPTHSLFTFDGLDHVEELTSDAATRARRLLDMIPPACPLVVPDSPRNAAFLAAARARRACVAAAPLDESRLRPHAAFLAGAVLEVLRLANLDPDAARAAVVNEAERLQRIPVFRIGEAVVCDLLSANDPDSAGELLLELERRVPSALPLSLLYLHRRDRPGRLEAFAPLLKRHDGRVGGDPVPTRFLQKHGLTSSRPDLFGELRGRGTVALLGNSGGHGGILREKLRREGAAEAW